MKRMKDKLGLSAVSDSLPPPPESAPPSAAPPWIELPSDVTGNILRRLEVFEILECAQLVCTTWWRVCQDPATWRVIKIVNDDRMPQDCSIMCRRAVDRSQGQLVDLTIAYFGDCELLLYIANRSSHLKRLTLAFFKGMNLSQISVGEAVKKLPELEDLHLISSLYYSVSGDLEPLTIACSALTSFSINELGCREVLDWLFGLRLRDRFESAAAIAKNMLNLCHLGLLGIELSNEALEALLDGCPRLESLDLRGCSGVDLGGELGERCRLQIKNLRLPSDSVDDCELKMKPFDLSPDPSLMEALEAIDISDCDFGFEDGCGCGYDYEE